MTEHFFQTKDAKYAYTVIGEGEPILLFHGFTGSRTSWEKIVPKLATRCKVITIDLPGHGKTVCETPRTMETFSEDVIQLLTFLNIEKLHVLGYSMGGRTALSFAMYYPQFVQTLILESASPGLKTEVERMSRTERDNTLANRIEDKGVESFVDYWEEIPLFATQKQLSKDVQEAIRKERLRQNEKGLADSLRFMGTGKQPSWWDKLAEVHIPVLLIAGEADEKFVQMNKEMNKLFPNSELKIVERAGHTVHVEQPEKFVTIVMEFIAK
mgnify:FL=1